MPDVFFGAMMMIPFRPTSESSTLPPRFEPYGGQTYKLLDGLEIASDSTDDSLTPYNYRGQPYRLN